MGVRSSDCKGIAYDTPIPGYRVPTTNILRLWKAEATESFDFEAFNVGDYYGAVDQKVQSETISKVLYPNDEPDRRQTTAPLAAVFFRLLLAAGHDPAADVTRAQAGYDLGACWAAQLNDTHPSIAVAELMRLLMDEHLMGWEEAWAITERTCGYTNHTLLAEALEKWPLSALPQLLPRHLEIIYEINRRFLDDLQQRHPGEEALVAPPLADRRER